MFPLPHTYKTVHNHLQYVSDNGLDEFRLVIRQLPGEYSDEFGKLALHFIHKDGCKVSNNKF